MGSEAGPYHEEDGRVAEPKPRMLLHLCCAPCSTHVVRLLSERYLLTGYFYDPNIHPEEEYLKRLGEMRAFASKIGFPLVVADYEDDLWFRLMRGLEGEPEGGERCRLCYRMRLERAARFAADGRFEYFATVLSVSPHKRADIINGVGIELAHQYGVRFLKADFKKRDGFKKSVELSREHGLQRQDYCGCIYSLEEARRRKEDRMAHEKRK